MQYNPPSQLFSSHLFYSNPDHLNHTPELSKMSQRRIVLVTGSNRGIGYEAVKYLSQQLPHAKILLSSRSVDSGNAAVKKMQAEAPNHDFSNVEVIQLDITDSESLANAVQTVQQKYGQLTDLLHNTGIADVKGDLHTPAILDVNVRCAKDTVEAFLPIIPAKTGRISLVSSQVGAWYAAAADPELQGRLNDVSKNDYTTIAKLINDWIAFSQGEPSELKWNPPNDMLSSAYGASKALVTAWVRHFAQTETKVPIAIDCPGYCQTELTGGQGTRSAAQGAWSVAWPLLNDFESGHFYQDGKDLPHVYPMPSW